MPKEPLQCTAQFYTAIKTAQGPGEAESEQNL